jgi:hypothetical protein
MSQLLYSLGALNDACRLTDKIGAVMAELPIEPMLAKIVTLLSISWKIFVLLTAAAPLLRRIWLLGGDTLYRGDAQRAIGLHHEGVPRTRRGDAAQLRSSRG